MSDRIVLRMNRRKLDDVVRGSRGKSDLRSLKGSLEHIQKTI